MTNSWLTPMKAVIRIPYNSFFVLQTCGEIDVRVASERHSSPFILVTGTPGEECAQYFICSEKRILLETRRMKEAVLNLMSVFLCV